MKKIIFLALSCLPFTILAQQNLPLSISEKKYQKTEKEIAERAAEDTTEKFLGLYGIGNLNSEAFNNVNSSGKLSLYFKPWGTLRRGSKKDITPIFFLSFNKNATNNDSLLASTIIFPEVGNHSVLVTAELHIQMGGEQSPVKKIMTPFIEFANKNVKETKDSVNGKRQERFFSTLSYTAGLKYLFSFDRGGHKGFLGAAAYVSHLNIPDEDREDFRFIFENNELKDNFWSAGIKFSFQINNFQIFADLRHVLGSASKIPTRDLRGFNSNIGVVFNAEIFEL